MARMNEWLWTCRDGPDKLGFDIDAYLFKHNLVTCFLASDFAVELSTLTSLTESGNRTDTKWTTASEIPGGSPVIVTATLTSFTEHMCVDRGQ
jgi:hypothetical protein